MLTGSTGHAAAEFEIARLQEALRQANANLKACQDLTEALNCADDALRRTRDALRDYMDAIDSEPDGFGSATYARWRARMNKALTAARAALGDS